MLDTLLPFQTLIFKNKFNNLLVSCYLLLHLLHFEKPFLGWYIYLSIFKYDNGNAWATINLDKHLLAIYDKSVSMFHIICCYIYHFLKNHFLEDKSINY